MQKRNKVLAGVLTGALVLSAGPMALAATANYNDSSVTGGSAAWQDWVKEWETVAADYTKVSLTPGADETQLNFAWYSKTESGKAATPVVHFGTDKDHLTAFTGKAAQVDDSLTDGVAYDYNHVTVTGLEANTTYYYTVEKNGVQSEVQEYKTGSFDSVKMLYVGDPQIGASKGQPQNGEALTAGSGAANTAARNDAFAWNRTLEIATAQNPGVNFIISAGDQVNKTGQAKEEEYAGYLSPAVLAGLPVATTIGNHDSLNPDYTYHFNNPNATENGKTQAGGDYYYSYGAGLFIVLNTNNYNVAEHEKTIQEAIASAPDAAWRVVTIHQDIYGTGLDHSDTDGMILRTQLTPIFDKYDIDVVLQGHDHTYSRSKLLYGDGQTHGTYEFRLNADGSDYDWDNAFNTQTDEKIPLYPEEGDTASTALHDAFQADNGCYTIEDTTGNTVVNPKGTLYMTANSASGFLFGAGCTVGMKVVVMQSVAGDSTITSIYSQDREWVIYAFAAAYLLVLCLVGGKQGLKGALGLVFTFFCILFVYLPLVYRGWSPFWVAVLICIVTTLVTMYLIGGPTRKTVVAAGGTVAGVVIAGLAATLFSLATGITGWNVSDIESLLTLASTSGIQVGGLLFSGLLISSLGAVMDVAMSIASAIAEIHVQNPALSRRALFRAGMHVGRDMMGTDSNTLILAFAGGSISMLVLDYAYNLPYRQIINSNNIGIAIMQGLSGSFGIVLAVPVTVALAVLLYTWRKAAPAA